MPAAASLSFSSGSVVALLLSQEMFITEVLWMAVQVESPGPTSCAQFVAQGALGQAKGQASPGCWDPSSWLGWKSHTVLCHRVFPLFPDYS